MKVLLTRPRAASLEIASLLADQAVQTVIWPLTEITPMGGPIAIPDNVTALVLTSKNGFGEFAARSERRDLPVFAVGPQTADAAGRAGFSKVISADGDGEALADLLSQSGHRAFYHPRGRDSASDLRSKLAIGTQTLHEQILYFAEETEGPDQAIDSALSRGEIGVITVWSARNGVILADWFSRRPEWRIDTVSVVAISSAAAEPLNPFGFKVVRIAVSPNRHEMLNETLRLAAF